MKIRKTYEISLFVAGCILINYFGKAFSDYLTLPMWLDSVGTVFAAYLFGPVCGAVVGATSNIMYCMHSQVSLFYGLTNLVVGIVVGICARKGFLKNLFGVLSTAFLVTVLSVLVSAPLNFILADGATGNVWGDGVASLLQELGCHARVSYIIGEFYLDFVDKVITMVILFVVVQIFQKRKKTRAQHKLEGKRVVSCLLLFTFPAAFLSGSVVCAENAPSTQQAEEYNFHKYVQTVYNGENGLPGGSANDIVQAKDGILWIGTYGGLYRYSGNHFQWVNEQVSPGFRFGFVLTR